MPVLIIETAGEVLNVRAASPQAARDWFGRTHGSQPARVRRASLDEVAQLVGQGSKIVSVRDVGREALVQRIGDDVERALAEQPAPVRTFGRRGLTR